MSDERPRYPVFHRWVKDTKAVLVLTWAQFGAPLGMSASVVQKYSWCRRPTRANLIKLVRAWGGHLDLLLEACGYQPEGIGVVEQTFFVEQQPEPEPVGLGIRLVDGGTCDGCKYACVCEQLRYVLKSRGVSWTPCEIVSQQDYDFAAARGVYLDEVARFAEAMAERVARNRQAHVDERLQVVELVDGVPQDYAQGAQMVLAA